MTKRTSAMVVFIVLWAVAACAQDLTLDEILKKYDEALGGADAIANVRTLRMTSRAILGNGDIETMMTQSVKRPNLVRAEISTMGNSVISGFDGTTGWILTAGSSQAQKLDEAAVAKIANNGRIEKLIGSLAGLKAVGNKVELLGKENVNGALAYKLGIALIRVLY